MSIWLLGFLHQVASDGEGGYLLKQTPAPPPSPAPPPPLCSIPMQNTSTYLYSPCTSCAPQPCTPHTCLSGPCIPSHFLTPSLHSQ